MQASHEATRRLEWLCSRREEEGGLPADDRAALRRLTPAAPLPPACWRQLVALDIVPAEERAYAVLLRTMLEAGVATAADTPAIGAFLAGPAAGSAYAEMRFVRLLRARGLEQVAQQARQVASWCAAQGGRIRFSDRRPQDGFGRFILAAAQENEAEAERRAHAIARDYFATLHRRADRPSES